MKRARDAYPEKYAAAVARKKARMSAPQTVKAEVARQIRALGDTKYTDIELSNQQVSSSGVMLNLLGTLTRGDDGLDQFSGNSLNPSNISLKYVWTTNDETFTTVRVLIFQWGDASTPNATGIIQSGTALTKPLSALFATNRSLIKVLYDRTHVMVPQSGDGTTPGLGAVYAHAFVLGSRMRKVRFASQTTNLQDGGLYCLFITDDPTATYPLLSVYSRVTFTDA